MIIFYPYKIGSMSLKNIRERLNERSLRVYPDRGYKPKKSHVIINWGNSTIPKWAPLAAKMYNNPIAVGRAINKLTAFEEFKRNEVPIPEFTTSIDVAKEWINSGATVLARSGLGLSGGRGINICSDPTKLPNAPLYVKYKKKKKEFRVHVFNGEVIDVLEKRKRNGFNALPDASTFIRSHHNGWVFCRDDIVKPTTLDEVAIKAVAALGLDFGGVDVIWNAREDKCYVLEVNTAPGLEGTSVDRYIEAITKL